MTEPCTLPTPLDGDAAATLLRLLVVLAERGLVPFERPQEGDALWIGPAMADWLRCDVSELPRRLADLHDLVHADDLPFAATRLAQPHSGEMLVGRLADGAGGWYRLHQTARLLRLADGSGVVSGLWRVLDEVAGTTNAIATPDAMRLLGRASHEIRGPLIGFVGLVQLALRLASTETQRRYLDLALQSGRTLTSLLEQTMDLARLSEGVPALDPQWIDLDATLCEAVRAVTPTMGLKNFAVVYDCDAENREVHADGLRLRQIVTNLFANAVRHTERGQVSVLAELRRTAPGNGQCRLIVEDTGAGIRPERVATLFDPFVHAAQARQHGGHGLGLTIVKALVDAMGGRIAVTSRLGEGTRFELNFDWPAREGAAASSPAPGHAWLVYPEVYAPAAARFVPRLARMGWTARILGGVQAAVAACDEVPAPDLMLVAGLVVEPGGAIEQLTRAFPRVRKALMSRLDWSKPTTEERALEFGWTVVPVPVGLRDLELLTRGP